MRPVLPTCNEVRQLPLTHQSTVPDEWIDVMGHMNVAHYTAAFSAAMQSLRSTLGLDNQLVQEQQIGSFALETHTRYIAELRVGDVFQIHSRVLERSRSRTRLHAMHFLVNARTERLSTTFEAIVANVDLQQRRMTPFLADVLARLDDMIEEHQKLDWAPPVCGVLTCN